MRSAARIRPTSCSTSAAGATTTRRSACITIRALIPLKTLHFDEGINVTLGLPIVRTSPDHGTAFDIAGQRPRRSRRDDRRDPHRGRMRARGSPRREPEPAAAARGDRAPRAQRVEGARPEFPARRAIARPDRARSRAARRRARLRGRARPGRADPRAAPRRRRGDRGRARPALPRAARRAGRGRRRAADDHRGRRAGDRRAAPVGRPMSSPTCPTMSAPPCWCAGSAARPGRPGGNR